MILLIGGITEATSLAEQLAKDYDVLLSVASPYGASLAQNSHYQTICGKRDAAGFVRLMEEYSIRLIVDCSHPFAEQVSKEVETAAQMSGIPLLRYRRSLTCDPQSDRAVLRVRTFSEAAHAARQICGDKLVFSSVGANHLPELAAIIPPEQIVARVLDRPESLEVCRKVGIPPQQILAKRGPFSVEENLHDFGQFSLGVLISKDSGSAGGTPEKLEAAACMNLPVILILPPHSSADAFSSLPELIRAIHHQLKG
ncbi:MAG: precorrin-6A reductase [Candidatus Merdivicinus sp.]|jgi:precorrin-6A/cobalt-precorrin-6A reductase